MRLPALLGALSSFALACAPKPAAPPDTSAEDRAAVDRGHEAFLAAMQAGDCNALVANLAEDGVMVAPNTPTAAGHAAIRAWCEPIFQQVKTTAVSVSGRDVVVSGDWAIEYGDFEWAVTPVAGGPEQREHGRFVAVWQRQADSSWKLVRDIWNSADPLPAAGAR